MTWALKRQLFYVAVLFLFFAIFAFLIIYPKVTKAPTCFDSKQNGDETGTDCGGSCILACTFQVDQISIFWARAFRVVPGRYNAVAYLENHNINTAVYKLKYRFRFSDKNNVYVGKREGTSYIPPSGKFAIFEPAIDLGNSVPVFTSFEFTETPIWIQVSTEKINQLKVLVSDIQLKNEDTAPFLSATIKNNSLFRIPEVNVIAILYDANRNAISTSRTYLDELKGEESAKINFTWQEPLSGKVILKEIIPIFNIFSVKLQ